MKVIHDLGYEIYHTLRLVEQREYGGFGDYRFSDIPVPVKVNDELYGFEELLDRYNQQLRTYEDQIRLSIQDAVIERPAIPRLPANQITQLGSGQIQWQAGPSPGSKQPQDYVEQALAVVLEKHLMNGTEASIGLIRDNAPSFFDQLTKVISEDEIGSLATRINQNMQLPQRKYSKRRLEEIREEVLTFKLKTVKVRPPPRG